ncbi:MAG: Ig-like domain-containing protein [Oscillospiraceae bacterium]|nr:Ig-like domain-containing protein [Oscillospiraceae bacterium]
MRKIYPLILLLSILLVLPASAETGDGDGGGGGPALPLYMDWSYPADGASDVPVGTIIQLKFSHNVAHYIIAARNCSLISLWTQDGQQIAATVYVVDSQIEFDRRQYIYVYPTAPLQAYTGYTVRIAEGVQAKNYMTTEGEQTVSFTTGSAVYTPALIAPMLDTEQDGTAAATETPAPTESEPVSQTTAPTPPAETTPVPTPAETEPAAETIPPEMELQADATVAPLATAADTPAAAGMPRWVLPAVLICAVVLGFCIFLLLHRKDGRGGAR